MNENMSTMDIQNLKIKKHKSVTKLVKVVPNLLKTMSDYSSSS
jgi:hypothetical protein